MRGQRLQPVVQVSGGLPRPPFAEQVGVQGGQILAAFADRPGGSPLFRKTSGGIAYAHRIADYNGYVGISEFCDICRTIQLRRCADECTGRTPSMSTS